ncbi:MAG: HAMP domain-containing histidine kinase [Thermoleophilia bacterium]|nr:HAMP domain-containing histidine kinase [Thermoleophilia bacterium]
MTDHAHIPEPAPDRLGDDDLLVIASEELRGPLTSVAGFLQLMLDGEAGELSDGQARVAEIAARNADRMARMVDDLIVIAQVRAGGLDEARVPVDVEALVRERVYSAGAELRARRASVGLSVDPCPPVVGDAPSLAHMIDHMLRGALTFVPVGGHITVEVHRTEGGVSVDVTDDGGELDKADIPFAMGGLGAGAARSPRGLVGSRMGLQLVREVARAHGGDAIVVARDGRTTVRATFGAE